MSIDTVQRFGLACALLGAFACGSEGSSGPPPAVRPCETQDDCDDGRACTEDYCVAGLGCGYEQIAVCGPDGGVVGEVRDGRPTVRLVAPREGDYVDGDVEIVVEAEDEGAVVQVALAVDGQILETRSWPPYSTTYAAGSAEEGRHTITVVAQDDTEKTRVASAEVIVDRTPPSIRLEAPSEGETHGDELGVRAVVSDNIAMDRVDLYLAGERVDALTGPSWAKTISTIGVPSGTVEFLAVARDGAGLVDRAAVSLYLDHGPTVRISAPQDGSVVWGTVEIVVAAEDDFGLESLEVALDDEVLTPEFDGAGDRYFWDPPYVRGEHVVRATAIDSAGQRREVQHNFTIDHPLEVEFVRPVDGDTIAGVVDVLVDTRDDDGEITSVEILVDGNVVGFVDSQPFATTIDTASLEDGGYDLVARVTSSDGDVAEAVAHVAVNNCERDGDGIRAPGQCGGDDCDDEDGAVYPGAVETPGDGVDQNCDGLGGELLVRCETICAVAGRCGQEPDRCVTGGDDLPTDLEARCRLACAESEPAYVALAADVSSCEDFLRGLSRLDGESCRTCNGAHFDQCPVEASPEAAAACEQFAGRLAECTAGTCPLAEPFVEGLARRLELDCARDVEQGAWSPADLLAIDDCASARAHAGETYQWDVAFVCQGSYLGIPEECETSAQRLVSCTPEWVREDDVVRDAAFWSWLCVADAAMAELLACVEAGESCGAVWDCVERTPVWAPRSLAGD